MAYNASVIIPVYNAEKTLRRCVESVVLGTERNLEVILVEDCGKDNSWGVCQELEGEFPNVTAVRNEHNSGVSATRNHGLELAQGEYILFVDSDDWVSGAYASRLIAAAAARPEDLVLCGFQFRENMAGYQQTYIWDNSDRDIVIVRQSQFFELVSKVLIQSPCNKAFHRNIIETNGLRFDETQSMGEDFQFVLDYMEVARIRECAVLNEALYYYIRWNDNSLMRNFGPQNMQNAINRYAKLNRLSGEDKKSTKRYEQAVEKLKNNYIYRIVGNNTMSAPAKLAAIGEIVGVSKARELYREQKRILSKEKAAKVIHSVCCLPKRAYGKCQRMWREQKIRAVRKELRDRKLSLISQNCIGGVLYHDMDAEFLSPTINLFFNGPDFVKFVLNLKHYLGMELVLSWGETYPIGYLDDVKIHFMHYDTCREAKAAWDRRRERINWDTIVVLCTDMEGFSREVFEQWKGISYPKVLFTANPEFTGELGSVFYPQYQSKGHVPDLIPNREFYKNGTLAKIVNSIGGGQE